MAQIIEVLLPDIGDFQDVEIIELLVGTGDQVAVEDPLIMLESDKASMEIPSPQAGVVRDIKVSVGDKVNQGDLILMLEAAEAVAVDAQSDVPAEAPVVPDDDSGESPVEESAVAAQAVSTESTVQAVSLPDIGDFHDVEIIELLVSVGDAVEEEQSLMTLESDKATMEIPSPFRGVVRTLEVSMGDKVNQGDLIATVETDFAPTASTTEAETDLPRVDRDRRGGGDSKIGRRKGTRAAAGPLEAIGSPKRKAACKPCRSAVCARAWR